MFIILLEFMTVLEDRKNFKRKAWVGMIFWLEMIEQNVKL